MKAANMYYNKLWNDFIKGDRKALALIFQGFYEELFSYGIKLTGSKDITEDSLQDLFLKLWKTKNNLSAIENIKAYLFTAFRRNIFDNLKWYNKHDSSEINEEKVCEIEFSVEDILIRKQINVDIRENLLKSLNNLSARQKEVVYLRYFENLDFNTIASVMEVNTQSVRNLIHRALSTLREVDI